MHKSESASNIDVVDYDDMFNISGEMWFNLSCDNLKIRNQFSKNIVEPVICGCGIAGIILTMVVLSRKIMCTSTNCYLTALAVADLLFLLILASRLYVDKMENCDFHLSSRAALFFVYSIIFMDVFHYLTVGITVMLAVERYVAICHPLKALAFCTVRRARIIIVSLTIVSFILRSPKFFELDISHREVEGRAREMIVTYVYLYNEGIYTYIVTGFLLTFLPLVSLSVLNLRLVMEIRRSYRYLQHHLGMDWHVRSVAYKEEHKMTIMLVSVVMAFFICQTPYMIYSFIIAIEKFEVTEMPTVSWWGFFKCLCNILLALKSSCNFVLYCWFSEKFWTTFKRIFCLQRCPPTQPTIQPSEICYNHVKSITQQSCLITKETTC
ncbi:unnamed protein product [Candidula unifasciata]|uniref:G-protein coupled receptors family 1 profile domain-containing protein n=1 Tax=Candidula unifasciata TaxID=100452 RepID=A0A8S4A625_9EUPU|nr:unnamed protein product [Candidula unifasciata]